MILRRTMLLASSIFLLAISPRFLETRPSHPPIDYVVRVYFPVTFVSTFLHATHTSLFSDESTPCHKWQPPKNSNRRADATLTDRGAFVSMKREKLRGVREKDVLSSASFRTISSVFISSRSSGPSLFFSACNTRIHGGA